jgi:SAM-dependent methyltransferase
VLSIVELKEAYWQLRGRSQRAWKDLHFRLSHRGRARLCNVCGWRGARFYDDEDNSDVKCPRCYSLPRHRLLKFALEEVGAPRSHCRTLHVAPKGEHGLAKWLRGHCGSYVSIDKGGVWNRFDHGEAMVQMDLTQLALPNESMDLVICSHVLENIPEDRKAIREVFRVLSPHGMAALQVQLYGQTTVKGNADPGDYHHVWRPGRDYFQRYEEAGFVVQLYSKHGFDVQPLRLYDGSVVPLCFKPRMDWSG